MEPSIAQRNDIDLQAEVKNAGIGTGNGNEEVTPQLGAVSCADCYGNVRGGASRLLCAS